MRKFIKSLLFLAGMALLGGSSSAQAQFFNYAPGVSPYGYGWGVPYLGAAGGYLEGASSVINASGNLQIQTQEAKAMQEQLKQEKLRTRRQAFDQYRYEQMHTPTPEELKRAQQEEQLRRSRNDPPLTEIWSGKALNDLLKDVQQLPMDSTYTTSMLLDPAILQHINVTNGTTVSGSTRLLRDAKVVWPLPLKAKSFDAQRTQIDELLPMAVKQARAGSVDGDTLENLIGTVRGMKNSLRQQVADIPSNDYIRAKRAVTELEDATRVLQDPNVANYFNKWTARGKDMSELVKNMTQQGLQFAPANNGDQAAYTALHRLMVNYNVAMSAQYRGPQVVNRAIYALPKLPSP
jgi:hypothetical protein